MRDDVRDALDLLELEAGASKQEIEDSRRKFAQIYHPDRFPRNCDLASLAEGKMKEVNAAADLLLEIANGPGIEDRPRSSAASASASTGTGQSPRRDAGRDRAQAEKMLLEGARSEVVQSMGIGLLWVIGGGVLSLITLAAGATAGGGGILFYGAILYGGWRILRLLPVLIRLNRALGTAREALGEPSGAGNAAIGWLATIVVGLVVIAIASAATDTGYSPTSESPAQGAEAGAAPVNQQPQIGVSSTFQSAEPEPFPLWFDDAGSSHPKPGSTDRKGMMDAAREQLGTSAEFYVHDIAVKGNLGVADIEPYPNGSALRTQLAFERQGGKWVCVGEFAD